MSKRKLTELDILEIAAFADTYDVNESDLMALIDKGKPEKGGPWPQRLRWVKEDKRLQSIFKKYKYLAPLLNELKLHRAISQERNRGLGISAFNENGKEKEYVLLDISNSRSRIAKDIECSETTVTHYIRGLVNCGLMKSFKKGQKTYYTMATWGIMPSDADPDEYIPRKIMWFARRTSNKLGNFQPAR